jgi:CDP-diacylglycerol--serine O-phosphatidyltransferase
MLSFGALLAGFYSILLSSAGEYTQAAQMIMLSMILDGLDGTLARALKGATRFGAELDTFVDMTSFGIAPAVLAYRCVLEEAALWGFVVVSAMVVSGVTRLARFRVVDPHRGQRGYLGLPITVGAGWVAMFVFATESQLVDPAWFNLHHGPVATLAWTSVLAFTFLQVSRVRYAKPTKDPVFLAACVLVVLLLFARVQMAVASALTICAYGFMYAFVSPFLRRRRALMLVEEEQEEKPVSLSR